MRLYISGLLLAVFASAVSAEVTGGGVFLSSGDEQTALVELFTSEGCSSCPPADRWLGRLKTDSGLWRDYVPVAFHVDYWDYLGWADRFADAAHSRRQRRHAEEGGVRTVYTPGMFLNGGAWSGWRKQDLPTNTAVAAGTLAIEITGDDVSVEFNRSGFPDDGDLDVTVALLGLGLYSEVKAGENRGRRLAQDFVVIGVRQQGLERRDQRYVAHLRLPTASISAPSYALAAWVSPAGRQAPLQAVGGWLPAATFSNDALARRR